jgi:hypothetical protein
MRESDTIGQKFKNFTLMLAGILTAVSVISGGVIWMFQEKLENAVITIIKDNREACLRDDLSVKMDVELEEVDNEIEWMYHTVLELSVMEHTNEGDNKFSQYLEKEIQWRSVGYFVNAEDKSVIKYRHADGRTYDAWTEPATGQLYYIKNGYKYY